MTKIFLGKGGLIFIVIWMLSCPLNGQETPKKKMTEQDYHLWGILNLGDVSPDGNWISYQMSYENGNDSLFLKNVSEEITYSIPNGIFAGFYSTKWFATLSKEGLHIFNLKDYQSILIPGISSFGFFLDGNIIAYQIRDVLYIKNLNDKYILKEIKNVREFKLSPTMDKLVYIQQDERESKAKLLEIRNGRLHTINLAENNNSLQNIHWDHTGRAVTLYNELGDGIFSLLYYNIAGGDLYRLNLSEVPGLSLTATLLPNSHYKLSISPTLDKIYFAFQDEHSDPHKDDKKVEIWSGNAAYTYLQDKYVSQIKPIKLGVWYPIKNQIYPISCTEFSKVFLTGNDLFAVVYDPEKYESQYDYYAPTDYYVKNIKTGQTELLLKNHSGYIPEILPSPHGKYIAYFKSGNWWVYNLNSKQHINLTGHLTVKLDNDINDNNGNIRAYGVAGWTNQDNSLFIYDEFDIWKIDILSGESERITKGREKRISFRLATIEKRDSRIINYDGLMGNELDLINGTFLQAHGRDASSGFYFWLEKEGIRKIIYSPSKNDQLRQNQNKIYYREQRYDLSPRIMIKSTKEDERIVMESNLHHQNYLWGKAETVSYKNRYGKTLNGILYYPADFDFRKKYPMIVKVYEKQFDHLHEFIIPEKFSSVGFNVINYTQNGYFVLLPDIEYERGKVGYSAFDCVVTAVEKVKRSGNIDKVGIIGHSFGGYETNFIITQTKLFDAAVSGAGVSDLVSFYLNLNWVTGKSDMWRFENNIWRMGKSLFEEREIYYLNSPISFAENIDTPLLLWTGNKDYQVNWQQSVTLYLALRRLNKKQCLLIYPNESHALLIKENQADLTAKVMDWFDYHLKMEKPAEWIGK